MSYAIVLSLTAVRQLRALDPAERRRLQAVIDSLAGDPRPPNAVRLIGGGGAWRVSSGDCRVVYELRDGELLVLSLRLEP